MKYMPEAKEDRGKTYVLFCAGIVNVCMDLPVTSVKRAIEFSPLLLQLIVTCDLAGLGNTVKWNTSSIVFIPVPITRM